MRSIYAGYTAVLLGAVLPPLAAQEARPQGREMMSMDKQIESLEAFVKLIGDDMEREYGAQTGLRVLGRLELDLNRHNGPIEAWYQGYVRLLGRNISALLNPRSASSLTETVIRLGGRSPVAWPKSEELPPVFVVEPISIGKNEPSRPLVIQEQQEAAALTAFFGRELASLLAESWPSDRLARWMERSLYREAVMRGGLIEKASQSELPLPKCMTRGEIATFLQRVRTGIDPETLEMLRPFLYLEEAQTPHALRMLRSVEERLPILSAMVQERGLVPWEDSPLGVNGERFFTWCLYVKLSQPLRAAFGSGISIDSWKECSQPQLSKPSLGGANQTGRQE